MIASEIYNWLLHYTHGVANIAAENFHQSSGTFRACGHKGEVSVIIFRKT